MKFNKTLLAAALMVAAGSANAGMTTGSVTGANEAYLVAFDAGYSVAGVIIGRSYNLDLNTTFAALQADATAALTAFEGAGKSLATDANWNTFVGAGSTSQITYGVYAAGNASGVTANVGTSAANGVFISGNAAPTAPGGLTRWDGAINAINTHALQINTNVGGFSASSVVMGTDQTASGQADSVPTFDTVWGAGFVNPTAAYGSSDQFWKGVTHLGAFGTPGSRTYLANAVLLSQSDISLIGSFTLAGNTLSYAPSAVPVPAAVWMFGAGLMGVLRLNRRKSA